MDVYLDMGLLDHIEVPDLFFEPYQMVALISPINSVQGLAFYCSHILVGTCYLS